MLSKMEQTNWQENLLEALVRLGADGHAAAEFLRAHKTYIGFWRVRKNVGAFWTGLRTIHFNSVYYSRNTSVNDAGMLTLLIHEVKHLQQGVFLALSVYGELEAWQLQFRLYHQLTNAPVHPAIAELLTLPLKYDRADDAEREEAAIALPEDVHPREDKQGGESEQADREGEQHARTDEEERHGNQDQREQQRDHTPGQIPRAMTVLAQGVQADVLRVKGLGPLGGWLRRSGGDLRAAGEERTRNLGRVGVWHGREDATCGAFRTGKFQNAERGGRNAEGRGYSPLRVPHSTFRVPRLKVFRHPVVAVSDFRPAIEVREDLPGEV